MTCENTAPAPRICLRAAELRCIAGARHYLEDAQLVFDRYHITANLNAAVEEVRKSEARQRSELTGSKYAWLKRSEHLTACGRCHSERDS